MTDAALKHAYRRLTARAAAAPLDVDALAALADGSGPSAGRDARLADVAECARNADLLRVLRAVAADAAALDEAIQRERRPARVGRPAARPRRWMAVAASVALAGVVALAMYSPATVDEGSASLEAEAGESGLAAAGDSAATDRGKIMLASFEAESATSTAPTAAPKIFIGDFDS